jgi:hypothetical protein
MSGILERIMEAIKPKGKDARKDGDARFKCIGGPLHEVVVRVWPPYDYLRFRGNDGAYHVYELTPPLASSRSTMWVFVHNPDVDPEEGQII